MVNSNIGKTMSHVKGLGEEKKMIAFNPNAKEGERFSSDEEKGQPQEYQIGDERLAVLGRLIQIACLLTHSIADLAPIVKNGVTK